MRKPDIFEAIEPWAEDKQGIDDVVNITFTKEAGACACKRHIEASSASAAVNALGLLVSDVAETLRVSTVRIMSILEVELFAQNKEGKRG